MESRSLTYQKALIQLPTIPDRHLPDPNSDTWKSSKLKIIDRLSSKSPVQRNFFLPSETLLTNPAPSKTPVMKPKYEIVRQREKRFIELDIELDQQELKYQSTDSLSNLESLFFSYSAYLEGIIQCISTTSHTYKTFLTRAKTGFISVFRKMFPILKNSVVESKEKTCQTFMSINPNKSSNILNKLGDIINQEMAGTEKFEKFIEKNFILKKKKPKIVNIGTQTEYKTGDNGVILFDFKTYEELEKELSSVKKINMELMQEKVIMEQKSEELDDAEKLVFRNKVLESMVLRMRHSGLYKVENFECGGGED